MIEQHTLDWPGFGQYHNSSWLLVQLTMPFMEYQAATLSGCSDLLYQCEVIIENIGRHPASKSPKKKRVARSPE